VSNRRTGNTSVLITDFDSLGPPLSTSDDPTNQHSSNSSKTGAPRKKSDKQKTSAPSPGGEEGLVGQAPVPVDQAPLFEHYEQQEHSVTSPAGDEELYNQVPSITTQRKKDVVKSHKTKKSVIEPTEYVEQESNELQYGYREPSTHLESGDYGPSPDLESGSFNQQADNGYSESLNTPEVSGTVDNRDVREISNIKAGKIQRKKEQRADTNISPDREEMFSSTNEEDLLWDMCGSKLSVLCSTLINGFNLDAPGGGGQEHVNLDPPGEGGQEEDITIEKSELDQISNEKTRKRNASLKVKSQEEDESTKEEMKQEYSLRSPVYPPVAPRGGGGIQQRVGQQSTSRSQEFRTSGPTDTSPAGVKVEDVLGTNTCDEVYPMKSVEKTKKGKSVQHEEVLASGQLSARSKAETISPLDDQSGKSKAGTISPLDDQSGRSKAGTISPLGDQSGRSKIGTISPLDDQSGRSKAGTNSPLDDQSGRSKAGTISPLGDQYLTNTAMPPSPNKITALRMKFENLLPRSSGSAASESSEDPPPPVRRSSNTDNG